MIKKEQLTKCSMAGIDVILDHIGASYLKQNLESLNFDGRFFIIGTMGGFVTIYFYHDHDRNILIYWK